MHENLALIGTQRPRMVDVVLIDPGNTGDTGNKNRCEGPQKQQEDLRRITSPHPQNDNRVVAQWWQRPDKGDDRFKYRPDLHRIPA